MHELSPAQYDRVAPLFDALSYHEAVNAILSGAFAGRVYADDPAHPRAALLSAGHRYYLAGAADHAAFNEALRAHFVDVVYPRALAAGEHEYVLHHAHEDWEPAVEAALGDKHPMKDWRRYYALHVSAPAGQALLPAGQALLPAGYILRDVDAALLAETHLGNLDDLREEMCSERPTVDDFLAHSLAVCVAHGNDLVAWCLSEYDNGTMGRGRCEMGIFTHEAHRRKGLATAAALALAGRLHARGTRYIGWHCWRSNKASGATALRVGMELVRDYPVYFAAYDEAANLAINGNVRLRAGDSAGALPWFDRALATGRAPVWTHWAAACAAAGAGRRAEALERLSRSLDAGFGSAAMLRENQYLRDLHDAPEWPALMTRAEARERDVD